MNILDTEAELRSNNPDVRSPEPLTDTDTSTLSPSALKQIKKIVADDKAQRSRTWSWWENLRKTNYPDYVRTKSQMYRDVDALGPAFFGEED